MVRCHLNYAVADTLRWEQSATYYIDSHPATEAFVKNAGLGFAIPYLNNGQMHDYIPDFIVRVKTNPPMHLILETKGYDEKEEIKVAAARRWVEAVNADGTHGTWEYEIARRPTDVVKIITKVHGLATEALPERKRGATVRPNLRNTAPVLDPTGLWQGLNVPQLPRSSPFEDCGGGSLVPASSSCTLLS